MIGIDASDAAIYAKQVIKNSNFKNILILNSKVEEVVDLPNGIQKVDIIISEWMGVCLYHESMLGTVLYARDKWLEKNGILFPDVVRLFLGGINDTKRRTTLINRWSFAYGFDLSRIRESMYKESFRCIVSPDQVFQFNYN